MYHRQLINHPPQEQEYHLWLSQTQTGGGYLLRLGQVPNNLVRLAPFGTRQIGSIGVLHQGNGLSEAESPRTSAPYR
jgi:hypothetical protein